MIDSTAELACVTYMLCWTCAICFSAAACSSNDQGSMNLASNTAPVPSTIPSRVAAIQPIAERIPRVVFFLSGGGMVHLERGGRPEYHPARDKRPESMHGAQDFFVGAYVSQIAGGSEFEAATHYAQAAATLFMTMPVERRDLIRATQIRARLSEDDR